MTKTNNNTPRHTIDVLDTEILRAHAYDKTREFLLAHPEYRPTAVQKKRFAQYVARRAQHEPVAFIVGRKWFYNIELEVRRGVLIPRPETEMLVEEAIRLCRVAEADPFEVARSGDAERGSPVARNEVSTMGVRSGRTRPRVQIIDVGTGSGAIALTLAKHLPKACIIATDSSPTALAVARKNARRLGLTRRVRFVRADLLPRLGGENPPLRPIIVANLPYLPTRIWQATAPDVKNFEPRTALDGGRDGLNLYRRLFQQLKKQYRSATTVIIEIDPSQKKLLPTVIRKLFPKAKIQFQKDLSGRWRMCRITLPTLR